MESFQFWFGVWVCGSQNHHIWNRSIFNLGIFGTLSGNIQYLIENGILLFYDKFTACDFISTIKSKLLAELAINLMDFMIGEIISTVIIVTV